MIRRTVTDSDRRTGYDPVGRPGVSASLPTAAFCRGTTPERIADEIGDRASGRLQAVRTEAVDDFLAGHRRRRTEPAADPDGASDVLRRKNARANEIADSTLAEVRAARGTVHWSGNGRRAAALSQSGA